MRQQVQDGVGRPPRLIIIEVVLRETAGVEDAEMGIDARPRIRRRLAAIIDSGAHETAAQPRARVEKAPPSFGSVRPRWRVVVVSTDIAPYRIILINAARANSATLFCADFRLIRMFG